jgi:hypothetical protein
MNHYSVDSTTIGSLPESTDPARRSIESGARAIMTPEVGLAGFVAGGRVVYLGMVPTNKDAQKMVSLACPEY